MSALYWGRDRSLSRFGGPGHSATASGLYQAPDRGIATTVNADSHNFQVIVLSGYSEPTSE